MPAECPVEIHQLLKEPLCNHAWNSDRSKIAICSTASPAITIFRQEQGKWNVEATLKEHELQITGLDWCPRTNRIISASMDRNVYVWTSPKDSQWKPTLVALNFSKAATCVSWSPNGDKFAAGSSDGSVVVGHYEADNDWWVCKLVKQPIGHTITGLSWHPNNLLLAISSIDGQVRTCSGFIKAIDREEAEVVEFSFKADCPVMDVDWSPSGSQLTWTLHNGKVFIAPVSGSTKAEEIQASEWPILQVKFVSEGLILAGGHSYDPILIGKDKSSGKWVKVDSLKAIKAANQAKQASGFSSAMNKFKQMDDCGMQQGAANQKTPGHFNTLNKITLMPSGSSKSVIVSTSGLDGNLIIWNLDALLASNSLSQLAL